MKWPSILGRCFFFIGYSLQQITEGLFLRVFSEHRGAPYPSADDADLIPSYMPLPTSEVTIWATTLWNLLIRAPLCSRVVVFIKLLLHSPYK
jgi:hypothetical protein